MLQSSVLQLQCSVICRTGHDLILRTGSIETHDIILEVSWLGDMRKIQYPRSYIHIT